VKKGVGVHCGECGCYKETPHDVFLAWFEDLLQILTSNNIGWALWNFRGDFGVLDSGRKDVDYEDWYGHKLDRKRDDTPSKVLIVIQDIYFRYRIPTFFINIHFIIEKIFFLVSYLFSQFYICLHTDLFLSGRNKGFR